MEARYYTPKIEEFKIGFEYEFQNKDGFPDNSWIPAIVKDDDQKNDIHNSIYNLRCRYLDRNDIESLGFIRNSTLGEYFKSSCGKYVLRVKEQPRTNGDISIGLYEYDEFWVDKLIHNYDIKNRFELKSILKEKGILEK